MSNALTVDSLFRPVSDVETRLRALLFGAAGSGKTTTALKIALGLVGGKGNAGSICLLDSERGSAAKAGRDLGAAFVHAEVSAFKGLAGRRDLVENDPRIYIEAIKAASERYEVVVLDSLSHAWQACLELCDLAAKRFGGNSHKAWADVTPIWRDLISAILEAPAHVLCTARSKTKWGETEGRNGKAQPKAIGLDPEIRQGTEYEFDILLRLDGDHTAYVEKARSVAFDGAIFERPGEKLGADLLAWLKGGEDPMVSLAHQLSDLGLSVAQLDAWRAMTGKPPVAKLTTSQHRQIVAWLASNADHIEQVRTQRRTEALRHGTSAPPAAVEDAEVVEAPRGVEALRVALAVVKLTLNEYDTWAAHVAGKVSATIDAAAAEKMAEWVRRGNNAERIRSKLEDIAAAARAPKQAKASEPHAPRADELHAALADNGVNPDCAADYALARGIKAATDNGARALWLAIMEPQDDDFGAFQAEWDRAHPEATTTGATEHAPW